MDCDRQTVLIVDPDPKLESLLGAPLRQCNVTVLQVYSGHDALVILRSQSFSLVILEIDLPDMSGFQLVEAIFNLNPHQSYKFLTASERAAFPQELPSDGAGRVVSKDQTPQRMFGELLIAIKLGHRVQQLQREHTAMTRKLESLTPIERMVGRYAERWKVSGNQARKIITDFARSQRLSLSQLATIAETRSVELESADQELERTRKKIELRLRDSEPGVLVRLDKFYCDQLTQAPTSKHRIAARPQA